MSNREDNGIRVELCRAWHRTWGSRVMQGLAGAAALLLIPTWFTIPLPSGAVHAELSRLRTANQILTLALVVLAFLCAYRVLSVDLDEAFDSLSVRGGSHAFTFAAGRILSGAGGLALVTAGFLAIVEALDFNGQYRTQELVHALVQFANASAVFLLACVLVSGIGRVAGVLVAFVIFTISTDAAYQRGALEDGFITPAPVVTAEQVVGWLGPRPLIDPLSGIAAIDQSVALQQFPVREGQAIWGTDLIQVSSSTDVAIYAVYVAVALVIFYVVCRVRARQARTRLRPTTWTAPRVVGDRPARR